MLSWTTVQTLLIIFGPQAYRFVRSLYRSTKSTERPQPLPRTSSILLNLLFASALLAIFSTVPRFMPENVFKLTETRLSRSTTEVVFNRLEKHHPLSELDLLLKEKLRSKEGRLFYAAYGPDPLKFCSWCQSSSDYFRYLIPGVAGVHILHMFVIGIVTSTTTIDNPEGAYFRNYATCAGLAIAVAEIWALATFNPNVNAAAIMPEDVRWRYWDAIFYRGIAIAVVDCLLGYAIYLSATHRIDLGIRNNPVESVQLALVKLQHIESKLTSTREVRKASMMDTGLRRKVLQFWDSAAAENKTVQTSKDAEEFKETMFQTDEGRHTEKMCKKKAKAIVGPLRQLVHQQAQAVAAQE